MQVESRLISTSTKNLAQAMWISGLVAFVCGALIAAKQGR
jgi:hypothetical protein